MAEKPKRAPNMFDTCPKTNEKWVEEFQVMCPHQSTHCEAGRCFGACMQDVYVDWLRTLLTEKDKEREEAVAEERKRLKTTMETLLLGVQPLPEDADSFMGELEQAVVGAGYMVKEWAMQAFEEPTATH